jgi:hypothetical protein
MAVGDRTRTCYLYFSPDHYILGCPQLTPQQKEMAHQKRLVFSQIEKPFGSGDVPSGVNKPPGQIDRPYGQSYRYSRPLASNSFYSDARPPIRSAVRGVPLRGWRLTQCRDQWVVGELRRCAGGPDRKGARWACVDGIGKRKEGRLETGVPPDAVVADRRRRDRKKKVRTQWVSKSDPNGWTRFVYWRAETTKSPRQ